MNEPIPYGQHSISQQDIDAVTQVLQSGWLTQGTAVPVFEDTVARICHARHGIATSSGTAALHLACLALGLGPGDVVWTSPISFVASANCARYCGASVDFVDIDPRSFNLSPKKLAEKLAQARSTGKPLPKVVIPVHFAGLPCDMQDIADLATEYGFHIIEDAAHAMGASYQQSPVGSCQYSDITIFSFHPVKTITTAEGGMALSNNTELAERMRLLQGHGITGDPAKMTQHPLDGPWYYQQLELGYNYRMSDIHAALGISQLQRIETLLQRRGQLSQHYREALHAYPVQLQAIDANKQSAHHLFVIRCKPEIRREIISAFKQENIAISLHYIPIHTQPYYQQQGFKHGDYPEAEAYYNEALTIPLYPELRDEQQQRVIQAIIGAIQA